MLYHPLYKAHFGFHFQEETKITPRRDTDEAVPSSMFLTFLSLGFITAAYWKLLIIRAGHEK